ncbi:DUF3592 domain-containing protein [Streptomyces sp. NBC_01497]|uniref:DUF3592 domain-containing protein n=1 Tax=Streptomyces sp. NBC_01497 TaxID=2903885 RepID=UPI002E3653FE|nr:DUF3592 domain-containing protein [Streptomyces sp. NBC_01497]
MQIVFAGSVAFGGLLALLAGAYGLYRTRQILASGTSAVALVMRPPPGAERPMLQFETADGRVMELVSPVDLEVGSVVVLAYDPRDPRDVALPRHRRTLLDAGFVAVGAVALLLAVVLVATAL